MFKAITVCTRLIHIPNKNPFVSQQLLKISKPAIYHCKSLQNCYQECKKFFDFFHFYEIFRANFEKVVFLKNGHGRHQMGAMPTHFVFIFHKTWWGRFAESFTQKFSSVSKLPIFQKCCFFKNGPKNLTKVEKLEFFFAFLVTIL